MTAARTKRTKTTVKADPAGQWRGRVEAADWTTIGAAGSAAMRASGAAHPRFPRASEQLRHGEDLIDATSRQALGLQQRANLPHNSSP